MGLYASFTPEQLGYRTVLEQVVLEYHLSVEVDYSEACEAFCETFLDVATDLVPVDTGYLQSTIDADTDGFFCECMADAEYAQYVEYGTWKMDAQPYFEPALQEALEVFIELADEAMEEAQEELNEMVQEVLMSEAEEGEEEGGAFFGFSIPIMVLFMMLMFPLAVNVYGILDSFGLTNRQQFGSHYSSGGGGGLVGTVVEVIIT